MVTRPSNLATALQRGHAGGLRALGALADLELDLLVLLKATEAVALDLRVVHEDVGAAIVGGDETEALLGVEPLHNTSCHNCLLDRYRWRAVAVATAPAGFFTTTIS